MNYAAHNKELHDTLLKPEEPVIFTKADSALLKPGKPFFVPEDMGRIDYEAEVVVRICRLGKNIAKGRLNKFLKESCLLNQEYIWDKNFTVASYLKSVDKDLTVTDFKRFTLRAE
jgi:translation elongation factor EF-Ts